MDPTCCIQQYWIMLEVKVASIKPYPTLFTMCSMDPKCFSSNMHFIMSLIISKPFNLVFQTYYRILKNTSFHGKSGFIEFDENGDRNSMEYNLVYSRKDALGKVGLVTMGTWDRANGINIQDDWHIDMTGTESNPLLKVAYYKIRVQSNLRNSRQTGS